MDEKISLGNGGNLNSRTPWNEMCSSRLGFTVPYFHEVVLVMQLRGVGGNQKLRGNRA